MPFIQRNKKLEIIGQFANHQPGMAEEWIDPGAVELKASIAAIKARCKDEIDQICGVKRAGSVSHGAYIEEEYRRAYEDAMIYKAAGYTGAMPNSVKSWKDVSGMTPKAAADDIIASRDGYMALLDVIRDMRLKGKFAVDASTTEDAILAAVATVNKSLAGLA